MQFRPWWWHHQAWEVLSTHWDVILHGNIHRCHAPVVDVHHITHGCIHHQKFSKPWSCSTVWLHRWLPFLHSLFTFDNHDIWRFPVWIPATRGNFFSNLGVIPPVIADHEGCTVTGCSQGSPVHDNLPRKIKPRSLDNNFICLVASQSPPRINHWYSQRTATNVPSQTER